MSTIAYFKSYMLARVTEFTARWWCDRDAANHNFFYHVDDKFYEAGLRDEAEELLRIVFDSVCRVDGHFARLEDWARACGAKRALQDVPIDEAVERFRMFRRILLDYFNRYAAAENLSAAESLLLAEEMNNSCELSLQIFMTCYKEHKEQYFKEQQKRFDVERLAAIGQMAAGVAHEVRNPLTSARGFLQLLKERAPHHFVDIAMQELDRAIGTIQTMLDVAKPMQLSAEKVPVSMLNVLDHVVNLFQDQMYSKTLITDYKDAGALIAGREELLKQAFFNVLKNALEAMQETEHPVLTLRHYRRDGCVVVEVQDNGTGIPDEKTASARHAVFLIEAIGGWTRPDDGVPHDARTFCASHGAKRGRSRGVVSLLLP